MKASRINPDVEMVSAFITKVIKGVAAGEGVTFGAADLKILGASKRLSGLGKEVLGETLDRLEAEFPGAFEMAVLAASDKVKKRLRAALDP